MNQLNVQNYIDPIIHSRITRCSCHFSQIAKTMPNPHSQLYNKECPIPPPQITQFNFITLTSINKKGYDFEQLVGNTCIKRNYFLTHKSMVKPIKKPSQMFFISINQLTSFIIDLKQSKTQEDILMFKQLDDCM
jgi:hypothetical protein